MIKFYCDICNKELKEGTYGDNVIDIKSYTRDKVITNRFTYNVCESCIDNVLMYISEKEIKGRRLENHNPK